MCWAEARQRGRRPQEQAKCQPWSQPWRRAPSNFAILSESFINREWCLRELEEFAQHANKRFGIYIDGDKKRIFSIERMPVSRDVLPSQLEGTTTYRFFEGGRILRPTVNTAHRAKYLASIEDLLIDISKVLKLLAKSEIGRAHV